MHSFFDFPQANRFRYIKDFFSEFSKKKKNSSLPHKIIPIFFFLGRQDAVLLEEWFDQSLEWLKIPQIMSENDDTIEVNPYFLECWMKFDLKVKGEK